MWCLSVTLEVLDLRTRWDMVSWDTPCCEKFLYSVLCINSFSLKIDSKRKIALTINLCHAINQWVFLQVCTYPLGQKLPWTNVRKKYGHNFVVTCNFPGMPFKLYIRTKWFAQIWSFYRIFFSQPMSSKK